MLIYLRRCPPHTGQIALIGLACVLAFSGLLWLYEMPDPDIYRSRLSSIYLTFGSVFGPLWAAGFAVIYKVMRRPPFGQPIPL